MKKVISIAGIFFIIILLMTACSDSYKKNEKNIDNFSFTLNFGCAGGINCVDTYNGTFTKDLIRNGTETIEFIIPDDKMREIYEAFLEYNISELPDDVSRESTMSPEFTYIFSYTWGKEMRTIICNAVYFYKAPDMHKRLVQFADMITEYIYSTEEYLNMSPAEGFYY